MLNKFWTIKSHGSLSRETEKTLPKPTSDQTQIKVTHVGLNHLDLWVYKGVLGHKFPLPLTPGCDIVGLTPKGGRVLVCPGVFCGQCEGCKSGFDPLCVSYGILGETQNGGCADYVLVPSKNLVLIPEKMDSVSAAALPIPYMTAYSMLITKGNLKRGERILIHSAASSVSIAALQIAKWIGAQVTLTVGDPSRLEFAQSLGADQVLVRPERENTRYHMVVDHVGVDTFQSSLKSLEKGGRLVTCGATSGSAVQIDLKLVFFKNLSIIGTTMGSLSDLKKIVTMTDQGTFKPVIDRVMSMQDLPKALELISERKTRGKIVLSNEVDPSLQA